MTRAGKGLSGWGSTWFYIFYMCIYIYIICMLYTYASLRVWIYIYIYYCLSIDLSIKDPCHPALSQGRLLHNFEVAFATHGVARRHRLPFVAQLTPDTASMSKRAEKRNETWWDHQKMYVEWRFPKMGVPLNHPPIAGGPIYGSPRITKFKHMGLDGPIRDANRGMEPASDTDSVAATMV